MSLRGHRRPAAADGRLLGDLVGGGETDEAVDHTAGRVRLAEVEADERRHEVELSDCDETSVEPADNEKDGGEDVESFHGVLLSVQDLSRERTGSHCILSSVCSMSVECWRGIRNRAAPDRGTEPTNGCQRRAPARVGTPVRAAPPNSHRRRIPSLFTG